MVKKQAIGLILVLASTYPALSHALSLGDIQFSSRVNEPFKARIELLQATEQELKKLQVHVAPPSIFAQAQLTRPAFIDSLKFARSAKNGKHYIVITSTQPIAEADFNLLLEVTSPKGDLLKRYSVALGADQPSKVLAQTETEPSPAAPTNTAEQPAAELDLQTVAAEAAPDASQATNEAVSFAVRSADTVAEDEPAALALNLNVATDPLAIAANTNPATPAESVVVADQQVKEATVAVPVANPKLDVVRSARAQPEPPKVAIDLPKLAFKHRYKVRKADNIFTIAERMKVKKLTLDEKVLALYSYNPKAFVNGDLNELKVGVVLKTPSTVGKYKVTDTIPVQMARVEERRAPLPPTTQTAKRKTAQTAASPVIALAPLMVDPPLVKALQDQQLATQLKLSDLQERLTQAQHLLDSSTLENQQLKDLVQEKNHLLTHREAELASLQSQVAQNKHEAQALLSAGAAGPEGAAATSTAPSPVMAENTWQGVFSSPLVWKMTALSTLFLLLIALWQKRRAADTFMQLSVQNAILMPDDYIDEEEGGMLDFLWAEDELEQAREQLQGLRHSMASLREQSQRLQAYLNPEPMGAAV